MSEGFENGSNRFFELKNDTIDTKIVILRHLVCKLWMIFSKKPLFHHLFNRPNFKQKSTNEKIIFEKNT